MDETRADALTVEGRNLLLGRGVEQAPERAAAVLRQAAEAGSGEAAALLAALAARGVGCARSWSDAFNWLETAARLGHPGARAQLDLLGGARVDVERWVGAGLRADAVSSDPRIAVLPGFLSPEVCAWLIARGEEQQGPAFIFDAAAGRPKQDVSRTNTVTRLGIAETDLVALLVQARITEVTGFDFDRLEALNLLCYDPGQAFLPHFDYLDPRTPTTKAEMALSGQRVATLLVYLNDDYDGGETEFPEVRFRFRGAPGDALLFYSLKPSGSPDSKTLHAGLPPTRGR